VKLMHGDGVDGPIMSQSYVKMAVDADQLVELSCSARGWPTPTMTWSRNSSTEALADSVVTVSHDGQYPVTSVLNITSVQLHDLGVYICTAHNNMGVNVTHFQLTVRSKSHLDLSRCHDCCA